MEKRRILAPIDFTPASRRALAYAHAMARAENAALTILHVAQMPMYVSPSMAVMVADGRSPVSLEKMTRNQAEASMEATLVEAKIPREDLVAVDVALGDPLTVILDRMRDHDLIIAGTHGRRGIDHLFIGSVAEKIIRSASKPVITVPSRAEASAPFPPSKILVPVDFSDGARSALQVARSLADIHGSKVTLVHVVEHFPEFEGPEALVVAASGEEPKPYDMHVRERVAQELQLFLSGKFEGHLGDLTVATGSAHHEIIECATQQKADLIVMGTHGRTGIRRVGIGSVAERVVRGALTPVLTVRE